MSRKRRQNRRQQQTEPAESTPPLRWSRWLAAVLGLVVIAVAAHLLLEAERADRPSGSSTSQEAAKAKPRTTEEAKSASESVAGDGGDAATPDVAKLKNLKGRWGRTDASYVIEIRSVADDGKLDAAYYNPNPIRVSQAKAAQDGETLQVFVELRDVGYPGCTYQLDYHAEEDHLEGVYHQTAQGQKYQVMFTRL